MQKIIKKANTGKMPVISEQPRMSEAGITPSKGTWSALAFSNLIQNEITSWSTHALANRKAAEEEHTRQLEKAFREGYEKGLTAGIEKEREDRIRAIDALFSEAKSKSRAAIHNLEVKVVTLAVDIAEKLLRKAIAADPESVEEMVTEAMSHIIGSENVILKVSADDYKVINAKYTSWLNMAGSVREFRIEIDKRLRTGDYIIETEGGIIDAVVSDRIDAIVEELLKTAE